MAPVYPQRIETVMRVSDPGQSLRCPHTHVQLQHFCSTVSRTAHVLVRFNCFGGLLCVLGVYHGDDDSFQTWVQEHLGIVHVQGYPIGLEVLLCPSNLLLAG